MYSFIDHKLRFNLFKTAVIFNIHNKVVNVNSSDAKATSNSAKQRLKTIRLIGFLVYAVNF